MYLSIYSRQWLIYDVSILLAMGILAAYNNSSSICSALFRFSH